MNNNTILFHLAFPVNDIAKTKEFYSYGLGCEIGRESPTSVIMNLYGHQIVAHITKEPLKPQASVYPRHFGLIFLSEIDWENLLTRAQQHHLSFYQEPKRRFAGEITEHRTFFLIDPFYNLLEFKYYCHYQAIFGSQEFNQVGDKV